MLDGSSGSACSLLQLCKSNNSRLESRLIVEGKVTKSFPPKYNSFNNDKEPRLLRFVSSDKLQSQRFSLVKELKPDKGCNMEFEILLGHNNEVDGGPLHPSKDNILSFFKEEKEEGSTLIAISSA